MKGQNYRRSQKWGSIILFIASGIMILLLIQMTNIEFKRIAVPHFTPQVAEIHKQICTFRPISPEEAEEEDNILKSIAWPETPSLTPNYTFQNTSSPACSKFTILPKMGGGEWYIGDQLEVRIIMKDYYCNPKTSGGDFIIASLKNRDLEAGVSGQVVDHLNGSYTAVLPLIWEGKSEVEVILVHPSETITVLRRLNKENPDRVYFKSTFTSGSVTETTICNLCLRPTTQPVCNYTDIRTGEPWFCLKPKNLSCESRISHVVGGYINPLRPQEEKLFNSKVNMKIRLWPTRSSYVAVFKDQPMVNRSNVTFTPSGFYYKGVWTSLAYPPVQQFDATSIIKCLKGKVLHMYGDSTMRQWFAYLNSVLPDLKEFNLHTLDKTSPYMSLDYKNNILLTYHCHGNPIRIRPIPISQLRYIANELDNIKGGSNTIIAFTVWAHFAHFPMEIYIRRLMSIRSAVLRLLARAPDTMVVIRSGNLKSLNVQSALIYSDWLSLQRDKVLKAMFKDVNVYLINAWEMTQAHLLPHNLHPPPPIIKNMINVLLSYICPHKH